LRTKQVWAAHVATAQVGAVAGATRNVVHPFAARDEFGIIGRTQLCRKPRRRRALRRSGAWRLGRSSNPEAYGCGDEERSDPAEVPRDDSRHSLYSLEIHWQ